MVGTRTPAVMVRSMGGTCALVSQKVDGAWGKFRMTRCVTMERRCYLLGTTRMALLWRLLRCQLLLHRYIKEKDCIKSCNSCCPCFESIHFRKSFVTRSPTIVVVR